MKLSLLCALGPTVLHAKDDTDNGFLRRKRFETPSNSIAGPESADSQKASADFKMEDLWQQAAAAAQVELDAGRLLHSSSGDFSMSMTRAPVRPPTPPPTPRPNPGPTPSPTTAPVDDGPTASPVDCLLGKTREEYIFDLLAPITPGFILNNPTTPQGMAFDYLVNDDPHLENPCESSTIEQRYGLTTLYYSTQGDGWLTNVGWLGADQECSWFGVTCSNDPTIATDIILSTNNLIGDLPNEILTLEKLERLELFANAITGKLPNGISALTDLILLDLEQNLLTGQAFPTPLLGMISLLAYRASDNFVEGTIAREISNLQNLQQLWLSTNQVTGTIPAQLASPTNLQSIFLYENSLVGSLPTELGNLASLEDLRLQSNTLQETIPPELFSATNLRTLRLDLNFFSGTIPPEIGNCVNLADLRVDTNSLSGSIPNEIGSLTALENLLVNNNFFSGQIPNIFDNYERLDFFDAANNIFFGTIPESIFRVPSIRLIYLSNNTLTGTIPPEYSQPPILRDLYLDGNGLIGTVPSILTGELEDLNELLFQFNFLSGSVPSSICDLRGNNGNLEDLFADCGGQNPEIECSFPQCCNRCFEGGNLVRRRRRAQERRRPRD